MFQLLERALEECGNDIDAAIKSLRELCLSAEGNSGPTKNPDATEEKGICLLYAYDDVNSTTRTCELNTYTEGRRELVLVCSFLAV